MVSNLEPVLAALDLQGVKNRKNQMGSLRVKTDQVGLEEDNQSLHIEGKYFRSSLFSLSKKTKTVRQHGRNG